MQWVCKRIKQCSNNESTCNSKIYTTLCTHSIKLVRKIRCKWSSYPYPQLFPKARQKKLVKLSMKTFLYKMAYEGHSKSPTVIWGPLATKPPRLSARTLYRLKVESLINISAAIIWAYFLFNFRDELRKTHRLCSRVRYGSSRSSDVVDVGSSRKGIWLIATLAICRTVSETRQWLKIANFPYPFLVYRPRSGWPLWNF